VVAAAAAVVVVVVVVAAAAVVVVVVEEKASGSIADPNDTYTFVIPLYLLALLNSAKVLGQTLY
jgi:hypothetical protein